MRLALPCFALLALAAVPTLAKADDIVSFTVAGTGSISLFPNPVPPNYDPRQPVPLHPGTASGAFTYDFTNNTVLANTVSLTNGKYDISDELDLTALVPGDPSPECAPNMYFCQTGTLDDAGGFFYIEEDGAQSPGGRIGQVYTATITPVSMTPEPGSCLLLGTGLIGIAGVLRRRIAG